MMDFKKITSIPIIITATYWLSSTISESQYKYFLLNNMILRLLMKNPDAKTMTFMLPLFLSIFIALYLEVAKYFYDYKNKENNTFVQVCVFTKILLLFFSLTCAYRSNVGEYTLYNISFLLSSFLVASFISQIFEACFLMALFESCFYFNLVAFLAKVYFKFNILAVMNMAKQAEKIMKMVNSMR